MFYTNIRNMKITRILSGIQNTFYQNSFLLNKSSFQPKLTRKNNQSYVFHTRISTNLSFKTVYNFELVVLLDVRNSRTFICHMQ